MQENFTRKSNSYNESSSVFVTNKGENSSVIDTIEQIRDKPALLKNNLVSTNGSSNETRVKSGQVFVVDYANIRIEKFDPNGHFITKWGSPGSNDNQFLDPHSIVVTHPVILNWKLCVLSCKGGSPIIAKLSNMNFHDRSASDWRSKENTI